MGKQAVLLLAHGTPETVEQIPEYLRNVVSGRPLPTAVVEEIQHRYSLIGHSPLTEITMEQARLAEAELARLAGRCGSTWACETGAPIFPTSSGRCAPREWKRPPSSAWRRITPAPASAFTAAPSRPKLPACASISPPGGQTIRSLSRPLRNAFACLNRLSAEVGSRFRCCSPPIACRAGTVEAPPPAADTQRRLGPAGSRPLRPGGQGHCRFGGRTCAGNPTVVVCFPEPGRQRRPLDWSQR